MFDMPTLDATNVSMNYVGVLKDILKLNYGLVQICNINIKKIKGVSIFMFEFLYIFGCLKLV
jgi:hypothetical protein